MTSAADAPDQYRVAFDFEIAFSNGGGLGGWDFRLDIDGDDIGDEALADHIVRDLRLLMVGSVTIRNKRIFRERHKRATPAAPAAPVSASASASQEGRPTLVDLSPEAGSVIRLPAPVPALSVLADVPAVLVRLTGMAQETVSRQALLPALGDVRGTAVLIETGKTAALTAEAVALLIEGGAALVGIDGPLREDGALLAAAGIPLVGGLSGLDRLPLTGFRLSAVPAVLEPGASVPVRAWVSIQVRPDGRQ